MTYDHCRRDTHLAALADQVVASGTEESEYHEAGEAEDGDSSDGDNDSDAMDAEEGEETPVQPSRRKSNTGGPGRADVLAKRVNLCKPLFDTNAWISISSPLCLVAKRKMSDAATTPAARSVNIGCNLTSTSY